jgi:hypothetical protein
MTTPLALAKSVLKPGDVFSVRTSTNEDTIEFGEAMQGKPNLDNHVAGMHHWDGDIPWGLEGKPGGVGWVDMRNYIGHPFAYNNCLQPNRIDTARILVAADGEKLLGTRYDWEAIGGDTLEALHVKLYHLTWTNGTVPGMVVCSSYWAYLYGIANWRHPSTGDERMCEPADWLNFIIQNNYHVGLASIS